MSCIDVHTTLDELCTNNIWFVECLVSCQLVPQNSRRQGRKRGRTATSKRTRSKRKQTAEMLINQIGIDEFKKMVLKDKLEKEGKPRDHAEYVASLVQSRWRRTPIIS